MAVFEWEGRSLAGEPRKGILNAESIRELRVIVRRDGVILTKAIERSGKGRRSKGGTQKKVKPAHIAIFTRQLSTMITSGLPLVQSLDTSQDNWRALP